MKIVAGIAWATLAALLGLVPADALGQCCGDCNGDGVVTVDELLKAVNRTLTSCSDDGICSMESCAGRLTACQTDLAQCQAQPSGQRFPASGQTTAYGPGSDGAVRAGVALSYTDNGDGTITDNNTGLMWEKKDQSGDIHDWSNSYSWSGPSLGSTNIMDGTIATTFLATLNAGAGFAGHTDWRIPNVKELQSIVNYEIPDPAVDGAFNTNCAGSCTVLTCSCTQPDFYWSSTTNQTNPDYAWGVTFHNGYVFDDGGKVGSHDVRAIRGGL